MKFFQYESVQEFEEKAQPYLTKNEDLYSLFSGVLQGIKVGHYDNPLMVAIENEGRVVALFQMTPPHPLNMIIINEAIMDDILTFASNEFFAKRIPILSAIGLKSVVTKFAYKWQELTQFKSIVLMDQGIYRLDEVNTTLKKSSGSWRYAREDEAALIEEWYVAFGNDAGIENPPMEVVKERVIQFLENQEVFFWEDDEKIVSMMKKARPTEHGVTVSFVYTPQDERKKGYARTLVAAGSEELLKVYDFCVLYTDMMNPTSNKIYQEIGYQKIADSIHIEFVSKQG
ncbi:GNAT family N-acetyltransferase [Paenisporosarcina antarctica]|uniref:GNAT family N-acetyltransferase n=1 Tax=Paenisporosarcina antarctica TaxID=417367 RepID=A0A4P6ZUC6_9BACL|nr:GNAT family N-acetyltransferase [Paenisporosarcina antarctica]QBP39972.1 GNAT family N-acetyltransferase [Paenisporosarcina antarctica]